MWSSLADKNMDWIHENISEEIRSFRMQSFENFGIALFAVPASGARPVKDLEGTQLGWDAYEFEVFGETPRRMHIRIVPKCGIRIRYMNRWSRLSTYLCNLKPKIDWNAPADGLVEVEVVKHRLQQQARWWLANGKSFPFLKLPGEIREMIYGYAIGEKVEPYPTSKVRRLGQNTAFMLNRKANFNLLMTCKLVYKEASNTLHMHTPFLIEHHGVLGKLTSNVPQRLQIRQLELALTHDAFFQLFGGKPTKDGVRPASKAAHALRCMDLNRLELQIAPPSLTTASPWLDGACQRIVVDWILDAAWEWIRGHPVQVSGFIKTRQKEMFEAACQVERKNFQFWQKHSVAAGGEAGGLQAYDEWLEEIGSEEGGVRLDGQTNEEELFQAGQTTVTEWTPICICKNPCTLARWNPDD